MADSSAASPSSHGTILRTTDPFVLDTTIHNLETLSPSPGGAGVVVGGCLLPLGAERSGGGGDENRPYLKTAFNKTGDGDNDYRSPWKKKASSSSNNNNETEVTELEESANEVWDAYRQLYYGHDAVGSVFVRRKGDVGSGGSAAGATPSKKKKGGGVLEALFGIQKTCFAFGGGDDDDEHKDDDNNDEIARWDSVHTVTIEVPDFEENTCEYKIRSSVWCRYQPGDVGDVPKTDAPPKPAKKKAAPPPKKRNNAKVLDVARLEIFDKAANNWDKHHGKKPKPKPKLVANGPPPAPIKAVVTSSALYTKDTTKVCSLLVSKNKASSSSSSPSSSIPIASHIQNIGAMLEKIEADFRAKLERVDAPRCIEVLQGMYRPSLSPGLKLPNGGSRGGMISRLGGHATGMGLGMGLIGEIALKAKSKGLGDGKNNGSSSSSNNNNNNKALESILASEKKKLGISNSNDQPDWKAGLKKGTSAPAAAAGSGSTTSTTSPEFMKFRNNLKPAEAK